MAKATKEKVVKTTLSEETRKMLKGMLEDEKEMEFVTTGNVGIDLALTNGKGLPLGSSFLLWAEPGCGKTTLVGDICRRLIDLHDNENKPFKVLYLDSEGSLTLLDSVGLKEHRKNKKFIYYDKSLSWRQVENCYSAILNGSVPGFEDVKVIVIDSIGNILSDANVEKSVADGDFGTKARERGNFYSKFLPLCREHGITSIFISQARHNQEASTPYIDKKKIAATYADKHSVDVIIKCGTKTSTETEKVIEKSVFGESKNKFRWIMTLSTVADGCKNRFFKGGVSEVMMVKGVGCENYYPIRKILETHKLIENPSAGYYTFSDVLCKNFGFPTGKVRLSVINECVKEHIGDLVELTKKMNIYSLTTSEEPEVVASDEGEDTDE